MSQGLSNQEITDKLFVSLNTIWNAYTSKKLDMGKACIRFKKPDDVPIDLIGVLASKLTPIQWIEIYE